MKNMDFRNADFCFYYHSEDWGHGADLGKEEDYLTRKKNNCGETNMHIVITISARCWCEYGRNSVVIILSR